MNEYIFVVILCQTLWRHAVYFLIFKFDFVVSFYHPRFFLFMKINPKQIQTLPFHMTFLLVQPFICKNRFSWKCRAKPLKNLDVIGCMKRLPSFQSQTSRISCLETSHLLYLTVPRATLFKLDFYCSLMMLLLIEKYK